MATSFGYDGSFGLAAESAWGTPVANPTLCLEITEESLGLKQETIAKPLIGGFTENHYVPGHRTVEGSVTFPGSYETLALPLTMGLGTDTVDSTEHTITISADTNSPGFSAFVDRDGEKFVYSGLQVQSLKLSQEAEDFLNVTLEFAGKDESETTFTQTSVGEFVGIKYNDLAVTIGGAAATIKQFEATVETPRAGERFALGSRLRQGLGRGEVTKVTGSITLEYVPDGTYDDFPAQTERAMVLTWTGPDGESLVLTFPRCVFQGTSPALKNHGPIDIEMPFVAYASEDGTTGPLTAVLTVGA